MPPDRALSEAHVRLGRALRATRTRAGISTRLVPKPLAGERIRADRNDPPYYSSGHISLVESGVTAPSPELIDAYAAMPGSVRAELRSLYEQMLAATREAARRRRQGGDTAPASGPPRSMDEVASRHDVQQHYVVVSTETEYHFGPTGAVSDAVCTVVLRAKTRGVELYYTGFSYSADQHPGVLQVEALSGATILAARESPSGALGCYFRLDRELVPDDAEPHAVSFRIVVRSEARAAPRLRYFASGGTDQLILRAAFAAPAEPQSLWWFSVPDIVDAEYPAPGHDITGSPTGLYERRFERLVPGWCYGFAWTW